MSVATKLRGALTKYGPSRVKQFVWDREFASGKWANLAAPEAATHPDVERYAHGGVILDLGCGPGRTGLELTPGTFRQYLGVDISAVAIETARQKAQGRSDLTYAVSDLLTYQPPEPADVILLGDSLYYVPIPKLPALFAHYQPHLTPHGVWIVRVCDPTGRYQPLLAAVREQVTIYEDTHRVNGAGIPVYTLIGSHQ